MKYWRGYLVALIFAAIGWALVWFASSHTALVDMVYPYMDRLIINSLADWSANVSGCLWQILVLILTLLGIGGVVAMVLLRRNPIQLIGWILAVVCCLSMCSTLLYDLNEFAGPISEDVRLDMTDYTVAELSEATQYYRDQANALADSVSRDSKGRVKLPEFEELAVQAGNGFEKLTYEHAISLFAGSIAPVKKLGWSLFYGGKTGALYPLTGEACVNPNVPEVAMPFAMCKEMAKRMTISREEDAKYAAFMAAEANDSELFRYSAYCIAYYYCYHTLAQVPTSTAQQNAKTVHAGANAKLISDMESYGKFVGKFKDPKGDSVADMLACAYIQEFVTPLHVEEEDPFDPLDASKVDLTYEKPDPTPLQDKTVEKDEDEEDEESAEDEELTEDEENAENNEDNGDN